MPTKPPTKPIPIRFSVTTLARLDEAARLVGNTRAGLVKFCVEMFLARWERGGKRSLPLDWEAMLEEGDNRTVASREVWPDVSGRAALLNDGPASSDASVDAAKAAAGKISERWKGSASSSRKRPTDGTSGEK